MMLTYSVTSQPCPHILITFMPHHSVKVMSLSEKYDMSGASCKW